MTYKEIANSVDLWMKYVDQDEGAEVRFEGMTELQRIDHMGKCFGPDEVAVQYMDDDLREAVHADLSPCSWGDFSTEYNRRHRNRYGEDFDIN